ncbi:MAG: hypothetical protein LBO63_05840 [Oscillospiraceae bacterium]|jgi:hypothetical protein|nr:hypothetical protein [Oscillospiraceae bacterium]
MEFLLSHWHCILPIAGIAAAAFFMRDKSKNKNTQSGGTKNQPAEKREEE